MPTDAPPNPGSTEKMRPTESEGRPEVQLRRARPSDAAGLAELAESTFREAFEAVNDPDDMNAFCAETYGEAIQAREITDPALEIWVCEVAAELIAFQQLRSGDAPACVRAASKLEIQRFYVDSRWHGKGIAQRLMELALRRAREERVEAVWLGVWEHNPRAIAFYCKYGFEEVGDHIFRVGRDPQRDIVLVRPTEPG